MAANYWDSTQRRYWLFSKEELASMRQKLQEENAELNQLFPLPQLRHLNIYFNQRTSLESPSCRSQLLLLSQYK